VATTAWSAFLPDVLPHVAGVSDPLAEGEIRKAAIEFCHKSLAWTHMHDPVTVAARVNPYDYSKPSGTQVVEPLQVWLEERKVIEFKTPAELSELYGDWRKAEGTPQFITQERPSQFYLVPTPTMTLANGLTLRVALKPSRSASGVDSMIHEEYAEVIANGAIARLLAIPGKPWTNLSLASARGEIFNADINKVRHRVRRGYAPAKPRVPAQFF